MPTRRLAWMCRGRPASAPGRHARCGHEPHKLCDADLFRRRGGRAGAAVRVRGAGLPASADCYRHRRGGRWPAGAAAGCDAVGRQPPRLRDKPRQADRRSQPGRPAAVSRRELRQPDCGGRRVGDRPRQGHCRSCQPRRRAGVLHGGRRGGRRGSATACRRSSRSRPRQAPDRRSGVVPSSFSTTTANSP